MKRKKLPLSKKHLRIIADQLWRMVGVKVWGSVCICGKQTIHGHHYYYRGSYGHLRYDLDNFVPLCNGCHFTLHFQDPKKVEERIVAFRGQKWYKRLQKKSQERPQSFQTVGWYKSIISQLKEYLEA